LVISKNKNEENNLYMMAEKSETIAYEIAVKIQPNIRREIV